MEKKMSEKTLEQRIAEIEKTLFEPISIPIEITDDAIAPFYANENDAGCDIYANETIIIEPETTIVVKTGIKVAIPDGYELQIRPRSGVSLKTKLRIANTPGTIDAGYRDEIGVIITNTKTNDDITEKSRYITTIDNKLIEIDTISNKNCYLIQKGDRIAQFVLNKICKAQFQNVESVKNIGNNRGGGFGHTGVK